MFTISLITWILLLLSTTGQSQDAHLEGSCKWNDTDGMCILLTACPQALMLIQINDMKSLKNMFCGFEGIEGKVCCPINSNADLITFNKTEEIRTTEIPSTVIKPAQTIPTVPAPSASPPTFVVPSTPATITLRYTTDNIVVANSSLKPQTLEIDKSNKATSKQEAIANTEREFLPQQELNYTNEVVPTMKPVNVLPDRNVCGLSTETDRIFGGDIANVDEFPWLVRIKYRTSLKDIYGCGASLITDRYVLTAAHCVVGQNIVELRLGEWDAESEKDCYDGICSDPPVDVKIDKIIVHPNYKRAVIGHDIALLRMERSVNFTDFIRPVCLPNTDYVAKQDYVPEDEFMVAGWGKTELGAASSVKRKLRLKAISMPVCQVLLPSFTNDNAPYIICAGGRKGKDSCSGDSGGPLVKQVSENYFINWFLYGITSYGSKSCGSEGKPGIYTRITSYMEWIIQNITP